MLPRVRIYPRIPWGALYYGIGAMAAVMSFVLFFATGILFSPNPVVKLLGLIMFLSPWISILVFARLGLALFFASFGALCSLGVILGTSGDTLSIAFGILFFLPVPLLIRSYLKYYKYTGMILDPPVYWYTPSLVYVNIETKRGR